MIEGLIALILILFFPGFFLTLAFFPGKKELSIVERLIFSIFFSITSLPLLILIENQLIGINIDFNSVFYTMLFIIGIGFLLYLIRTQIIPTPYSINRIIPKIEKEKGFLIALLKK